MDAIKKKMEKLSNETNDAENRIAQFEEMKAANEREAEKYDRNQMFATKKIKKWFLFKNITIKTNSCTNFSPNADPQLKTSALC